MAFDDLIEGMVGAACHPPLPTLDQGEQETGAQSRRFSSWEERQGPHHL
jgi:hypothetical protein